MGWGWRSSYQPVIRQMNSVISQMGDYLAESLDYQWQWQPPRISLEFGGGKVKK